MENSINKYNVGILSAMPEEIGNTLKNLDNLNLSQYGSLKIYNGILWVIYTSTWKTTNGIGYLQ